MIKAAGDLWRRMSDHGVQNWYHARAKRLSGAGRLEPAFNQAHLLQKLRATANVRPVTAMRIGLIMGPPPAGGPDQFHGPTGDDLAASFVGDLVFAHIIRENNGGEVKEIMLIRSRLMPARAASGAHGGRRPEDDAGGRESVPTPIRRYLWGERSGNWSIDARPWH